MLIHMVREEVLLIGLCERKNTISAGHLFGRDDRTAVLHKFHEMDVLSENKARE